MKQTREELSRMHKVQCRELKKMRAKMAEDLGIDLQQRECTYEGYCSGTCPKCKSEELRLNAALLKRQLQEEDMKRRVAAAGLMAAATLCLSGCGTRTETLEGDMEVYPEEGVAYEVDTEYVAEEGLMPENTEDVLDE